MEARRRLRDPSATLPTGAPGTRGGLSGVASDPLLDLVAAEGVALLRSDTEQLAPQLDFVSTAVPGQFVIDADFFTRLVYEGV